MSIFLPISTSNSSLFDSKVIDQKWNTFLNDLVNVLNSTYSSSIDINEFNSIINDSLQTTYGLQHSSLEKFIPTKLNDEVKSSSSKKNNTTTCKGLTSKKTPCKLNALSNTDFCKRHSTKNETEAKQIKSKSIIKPNIKNNDDNQKQEEELLPPSSLKNKIIDIVKPKKEKASTKLIKATESISLPKREPFNFKTHKPVNIFDTKFWKIGPFLYDDDKDLIINSTTGLIFETISATEVKLFGRSVEGELILTKDCPEDVIEWAKKCGILIDSESEDEENDDESDNEDSEDEKEE
jgi:hypothetical protein